MPHELDTASWFDCGVNLTDERLDPEVVIEQSLAVGVSKLCVISTDLEETRKAIVLCERFPENLVCTAGVHPHYSRSASQRDFEEIKDLASHHHVVAIGECGLDFNRNFSPPEVQLSAFETQLQLACSVGKPVLLHERDAFEAQHELLSRYRRDLCGGFAHCFTGDTLQLNAYLELDLYIGITGWLCDEKRGDELREAVTHLPIERVLLETDAPYLWPKTLRPRKRNNVPANLPHIAEHVATCMNCCLDNLRQHTWGNALALFNLVEQDSGHAT